VDFPTAKTRVTNRRGTSWPPGFYKHCAAAHLSIAGLFFVLSLTHFDGLERKLTQLVPSSWSYLDARHSFGAPLDRPHHFPSQRHHGEPHGTKPVPEREAQLATFRKITIKVSSTISRTLPSSLSSTQWP
jgi:hypothetical protein